MLSASNIKFNRFLQSVQFCVTKYIHMLCACPHPSICNLDFERNLLNLGWYCSTRYLEMKSQECFSWSSNVMGTCTWTAWLPGFLRNQLAVLCSANGAPFLRTVNCLLVKFLGELVWLYLPIKVSYKWVLS